MTTNKREPSWQTNSRNHPTGTTTNRQEYTEMLEVNRTVKTAPSAIHRRRIRIAQIREVNDSFGRGSTVYADEGILGNIRYSTVMPWKDANEATSLTAYADQDGTQHTYVGSYYVESMTDGVVSLRLESNVACSDYEGCIGHEIDSDGVIVGTDRHQFASEKIGTVGGIKVVLTRVIEGGIERRNVWISEFDFDLDAAGVASLATDLYALHGSLAAEGVDMASGS